MGETSDTEGRKPASTGGPVKRDKAYFALTFGSLGIVFGDIGTSPIYALRESLLNFGHAAETETIGIVSLLIWSLILVVTVKYVVVLLRADNNGEGGTLSLMALAKAGANGRSLVVTVLGTAAAGLFYGDAIVTPAISVLSAVEGVKVVAPGIEPAIVPIAAAILIGLFAVQSRGTGRIGIIFAPVTLVWFAVLTAMGLSNILDAPKILLALSPVEAAVFLATHGAVGFFTLGSVFLAVTGAEALYADMGHFGRNPIRSAWLFAVLPALIVTYLGQGALALSKPDAVAHLFYLSAPGWAQVPLLILATVATVIASQAVITGTFSLTYQAMRLGMLPRFRVLHTNPRMPGQIYLPRINWLMLLGVLALLFLFKSSSALAGAYGIAVSGTMVITTLMAGIVFVTVRGWNWGWALLLLGPLLLIDVMFFGANLVKVMSGGFVPLLVAACVIIAIWTWMRGVRFANEKLTHDSVMLADLMERLDTLDAVPVDGTAVFLTSTPELVPGALLQNLQHNHVLHRNVIIVTIRTAPSPRVADENRALVASLGPGFTAVELSFGYVETPDVLRGLELAREKGVDFDLETTTFFVGRMSFRSGEESGMPAWQDNLFIGLSQRAVDIPAYYSIPADKVVELGRQIEL